MKKEGINMFRILLVDDEPIVRLTIRSLGDWKSHGFEIVHEASDGVDALESFKLPGNVDIVLTDISMPKMNGIELIKNIRELDKNMPIIVLSAYNDYQFVREAFKLGIQDYILKSDLAFDPLLKLLEKAAEMISDMQRSNSESISKNNYLKHKLLEDILHGNIPEDVNTKVKTYAIGIAPVNIAVAVFSVDDCKLLEEKHDDAVLSKISTSICNIFAQKILEYKLGEFVRLSRYKYVFIVSFENEKSGLKITQNLNSFVSNIKYTLSELLNISVTVGLSSMQNGYGNIPALFKQAEDATELKLIYGKGKIICHQDIRSFSNTNDSNIYGREKALLSALESEDEGSVKEELKKLADIIIGLKLSGIHQIYNLYLELIYIIFSYLNTKDIKPEDIFGKEVNFHEKIYTFETLSEISNFMENLLSFIISELKDKNKGLSKKLKRATDYIKSHFNEDISLTLVSRNLQVSEAYLSRLFTKETGETFINYLTRLRIEKAKDLLKSSDLTINEISQLVGYYNQEHFSRVFKKYEGCSPNRYRNGS